MELPDHLPYEDWKIKEGVIMRARMARLVLRCRLSSALIIRLVQYDKGDDWDARCTLYFREIGFCSDENPVEACEYAVEQSKKWLNHQESLLEDEDE